MDTKPLGQHSTFRDSVLYNEIPEGVSATLWHTYLYCWYEVEIEETHAQGMPCVQDLQALVDAQATLS
ncbi:MAG TPA: hypothetical protein VIW23_13810 [Candidatus Acidoferrum sp.]|jgi:hypothetical protein